MLHWQVETILSFKCQVSMIGCNICILLRPVKLCCKVHWTVNIVCPFRGLYRSLWPGPWDAIELHNLSPNAICWCIKGSSAHCSCEITLSRTFLPLLWKKCGILSSGYLQVPCFSMSDALGCKITIKHLLQSHEESICPFDVLGHQEARACGVA